MSSIKIHHPTKKLFGSVHLPGSKSESNRALILQALSGNSFQIENLSTARDTQNLKNILATNQQTVDVIDAGTSMRFLTAYYAATNQHKIITGSARMKKRPMAPLVNALNEMGFDIRYVEEEGFAPIEIFPIKSFEKLESEVHIQGNISSQFITALLLIAPFLPNGLTIHFYTALTSKPYVEMTLSMLEHFGVKYIWSENSIAVSKTEIQNPKFEVGSDWSAASYWYSMAFLADEAEIFLEGLQNKWSQGDRIMADWMKRFGIATEFKEGGALIKNIHTAYPKVMKLDFADNPDLAQTFAVMFAAKDIAATFTGIDSLRLKETDRIQALQNELRKCGYKFDYSDEFFFYQLRGKLHLPTAPVNTYDDHRMAMSLAALGLLGEIEIENPDVVIKSYPEFWGEMQKNGFVILVDD
ncbi:MAG: 3-phosphoshikimate 1-carboxyvinyltransferase [Chitinophagales bacterium]|nr:3-phosphoshikimate 1-carboxyvinyltransferase [Chitinophagales bacterium]